MWLPHYADRWSALARSLRRQLLPRRLSTGRLAVCFVRAILISTSSNKNNKININAEIARRNFLRAIGIYVFLTAAGVRARRGDWSITVHLDPHLTQNPSGNVLRFSSNILKGHSVN